MKTKQTRTRSLLTVLAVLTVLSCLLLLGSVEAGADEYSAAALIKPDGSRNDYAVVEAAIVDAAPGDTLIILKNWTPSVSVTFPAGVTVYIPADVFAGTPDTSVNVVVLGTLHSSGMLVGNWQLKGNINVSWDTDGDGKVDEVQTLPYNTMPSHADGFRPRDGRYVYNFAGWDKTPEPATEDVTYTAKFTRVVAEFNVGWDLDGDGEAEVNETYPYGEIPMPPADGFRPDDVARTYRFIGWSNELQPVTGDVVFSALFASSPRLYSIHWDTDGDGVIDVTEQKGYGVPLMPSDGKHGDSKDWTFTFTGWSPVPDTVTGDAVFTAQFVPASGQGETPCNGVLSVNMLNRRETELSVLLTLLHDDTVFGAKRVAIGSGMNASLSLGNLPDGVYTLRIVDDENGGCMNMSLVTVKEGVGQASVMLSGYAPLVNVKMDPLLTVSAIDVPATWFTHASASPAAGLSEEDWANDALPSLDISFTTYQMDAPFHETLEKAADKQKIGLFLQVSISKTVNDVTAELLRIPDFITLVLRLQDAFPEDFTGDPDTLTLYRVISGSTETITAEPNIYGEYYRWEEDGSLYLCLRGNATYGFACDVPQSGFPLWWIMLLFDIAGAWVLYVDRRKKPLDYPVRLSAALGLTVVVVVTLAIRQGVMEIVCASVGWLLLTLLIILSGNGTRNSDREKDIQLKFDFASPVGKNAPEQDGPAEKDAGPREE